MNPIAGTPALDWYGSLRQAQAFAKEAYGEDGEDATASMRWALLILGSLAEASGHSYLLDQIRRAHVAFEADPLAKTYESRADSHYWTHAAIAYHFYKVLETLHPQDDPTHLSNRRAQLEMVLRGSKQYIVDPRIFAWTPCDETDVHDRIESLLRCVFSDTDRKSAIHQPTKNFFADTKINSAGAIVEYKYMKNEDEKSSLSDQILADLGGYQGVELVHIFFVIYETKRFTTEAHWQRTLDGAKSRATATAVLLEGHVPMEKDFEAKRTYLLARNTK